MCGDEESARIQASSKRSLSRALDCIEELVQQFAYRNDDDMLDSLSISALADAMRLLSEHGRLVIVLDRGRRVIAMRTCGRERFECHPEIAR